MAVARTPLSTHTPSLIILPPGLFLQLLRTCSLPNLHQPLEPSHKPEEGPGDKEQPQEIVSPANQAPPTDVNPDPFLNQLGEGEDEEGKQTADDLGVSPCNFLEGKPGSTR